MITLALLASAHVHTSQGKAALGELHERTAQLDALDRLERTMADSEAAVRRFLRTGDATELPTGKITSNRVETTLDELALPAKGADAGPLQDLTELARAATQDLRFAVERATLAKQAGTVRLEAKNLVALKARIDDLRQQFTTRRETLIGDIDQRLTRARSTNIALGVFAVLVTVLLWVMLRRQRALREQIPHLLAGEDGRIASRVHERTAELQTLARAITEADEAERAQLAHTLDDRLRALLAAARGDAEWILRKLPEEFSAAFGARFDRLQGTLSDADALAGETADQLAPRTLAEQGLIAALRALGETLQERRGLKADIDLPDAVDLDDPRSHALLRVARAAVSNILRHAEASHVHLRLKLDEAEARLTVADNGKGFDAPRHARTDGGLARMRQRLQTYGGQLAVRTAPGQGTTVSARLPRA
ncbi:hypothetical protein G3580_06435 [Nitrogeniibacter mangrovi]|uniref:Histidine kinase domain-containing protein n=1 Tax=Nitrogeniibacter mangrovi TaxID=2016596 RepID=A0A6C1B1S9_9RHOO|nr:hypothetical protein G3580_06435 [Nitrogeniibacter mangrovi]